jgi:hypothetical protein
VHSLWLDEVYPFVFGVAEHIGADVVILFVGAVVAWLIAFRASWKLLFSVFRLARNRVTNVYLRREEYVSRRGVPLEEYIKLTNRKIMYVGLYFSVATDQSRLEDAFRQLIDKGCRVDIFLLDGQASDETVNYLERHFGLATNSLRPRVQHAFEYFYRLKDSLAPAKRELLSIGLHTLPLVSSAFLIDNDERDARMLVDIKWFGAGREKSLGIEFTGKATSGSLFETIQSSFVRAAAAARIVS